MVRRLAVMTSLAAVALVPAAPIPKGEPKDGLYFPIAAGTRWVYERDGQEVVDVITAVAHEDGVIVVSVGRDEDGMVTASQKVRVSPAGLFWAEYLDSVFTPPVCLLKLPHRPGTEWETNFTHVKRPAVGSRVARGYEEIKVPAGTYRAARVDTVYSYSGCVIKHTFWYAPEVGMVKTIDETNSRPVTKTLKSFTVGKN